MGCFIEKKKEYRLLNIKFGSFKNSYNATDPHATAVKCAHLARDMEYEYFAVQDHGDCRTDLNIADNYDTYGEALPGKCVGGVGAILANFVYRLVSPPSDGENLILLFIALTLDCYWLAIMLAYETNTSIQI